MRKTQKPQEERMKKKVVSILCLTTMLMAVFTGCGADQSEETKQTDEVKETNKQTMECGRMLEEPFLKVVLTQ